MMTIVFITVTLLSLILFYFGTGKDKRVLWVSMLWVLVLGGISYSGFFENTVARPPRFLLVLLGTVGLVVYLYRITKNTPRKTNFLIAIHVLRIPVELTLYQLFLQKKVPELMTFQGYNFDILVGLSALVLLSYVLISGKNMSKTFNLWWNVAGIIFLGIIVVMAILSSPLPIQQLAFDQPNTAVLEFPYTYLPGYVVPVVFLSHFLMLNQKKD